jgi:ubiquinone/menaquinone biosynthesis C-methylase UbiE
MGIAETREHVHGMWNAVAAHWEDHADYVDAKSEALSKVMVDAVAITPQHRVLELAAGTGGLGTTAAALAREVVVSDVAEAMVAAAARRTAGMANVTTKILDLEAIAEPDASFDVVLCREGLMFAVEPAAALREIRRVLRPGGRLAVAVWGPPDDNPWLGLVLRGVAEQLGRPMPPPGMPGPFSLSDADALHDLAVAAGFVGCAVERHEVPTVATSFEQWWERTSALAGPLANILPLLPAEATDALVAGLRTATDKYATDDGALVFPGVSLLLTCVTPAGEVRR